MIAKTVTATANAFIRNTPFLKSEGCARVMRARLYLST